MFYNSLVVALAILMGFVVYDLYVLLENQDKIYSIVHKLRSDSRQSLLTK